MENTGLMQESLLGNVDEEQVNGLFYDPYNQHDDSGSPLGVDAESDSGEASLLNTDDNMSFVQLNNDALTAAQIEARKKYFSDPKNQAEILLQNYIKNQTILVNRQQRKSIYKQYLRDARKGKFRKLFHDSIYGISQEEAKQKISKLND